MAKDEIIQIVKQLSERQSPDTRIVNNLFNNFDEIYSHASEKQAAIRGFYVN